MVTDWSSKIPQQELESEGTASTLPLTKPTYAAISIKHSIYALKWPLFGVIAHACHFGYVVFYSQHPLLMERAQCCYLLHTTPYA